jgi:Cof subfamily protein (haloacid dehalogenase superfamily)
MIKAIFCDLDGTLFNKEMELSGENFEAISELARRGVVFVPTTGRAYYEIPRELREHSDVRYFLTSNGSGSFDMKNGESYHRSIPRESAREIIRVFSSMKTFPVVHSISGEAYIDADKNDYGTKRAYRLSEYYCRYFDLYATKIPSVYEKYADGVGINALVAFFAIEEERQEAMRLLDELGVAYTHSADAQLEILNAAVGKGNSVLRLAGELGIVPDEIVTVGDSMNDKTMLEITPNSVVTSGANPHLFSIAKHVGCSNEESILRYVIDKFL